MLGFFFFFFIIVLIIILFGATLLHGIIRLILNTLFKAFGLTKKQNYNSPGSYESSRKNSRSTQYKNTKKKPSSRKKIFSEDEGEYVDFEEIKDK